MMRKKKKKKKKKKKLSSSTHPIELCRVSVAVAGLVSRILP
jgi:hypothetical protein